MDNISPVIVFAYNRANHLRRLLSSLSKNVDAEKTPLYIFCDGPKESVSPETLAKVQDVRKVAEEFSWPGPLKKVTLAEKNKGLGPSVISGVTDVVNRYGKVIVVEDDLVLSKYFLRFMNSSLQVYENEKQVFQVSGYMYPIESDSRDICFLRVCSSWGWATWADRWKLLKTDASELKSTVEKLDAVDRFNLDGSYPMMLQLDQNISGQLNTWAIKWYGTTFLNDGLVIHPHRSLVYNDGFDGSGSNCGEETDFQVQIYSEEIAVPFKAVIEDAKTRSRLVSWLKSINAPKVSDRLHQRVKKWFRKLKIS